MPQKQKMPMKEKVKIAKRCLAGEVYPYGRTYSPDLKLQAVQEYLSGKGSLAEISKKYGLRSKNQL